MLYVMVRTDPLRVIASVLLAATLLIGLAQVALLPPWEGFDETAHYSYVQQLADTGRWPRSSDLAGSADVADSLKIAPTPLLRSPWTYSTFPSAPAEAIAAMRAASHSKPERPRSWRPGEAANTEAQQPPLYYFLLSPAYYVSKSWSFAGQLALMRGVSYLIAWAGLCLAVIFALRETSSVSSARIAVVALALWPFLFPMWFASMARLGNDSLVVLIAACTWPIARTLIFGQGRGQHYAILGLLLGLGLLAKATFLPFVAVVMGVLVLRIIRDHWNGDPLWRPAFRLLVSVVITAAISGWWYLHKLVETGSAIGSHDVALMHSQGGLIQGLLNNASVFVVARIPWIIGMSFLWGGTWSFVLPPLLTILPLAACAIVIAIGYFMFVRRRRLQIADHVPLLTWAAMLAALGYHSLVLVSNGLTGAGGYYLHSFAPVLAPAVGFGIVGAMSARLTRPVLSALLCYPLLFLPLTMAMQAMFFSGCGIAQPTNAYYPLSSMIPCAGDWRAIFNNLSVFDYPQAAAALFICGWGLSVIGIVVALQQLRMEGSKQWARDQKPGRVAL
jgi:hypothetical protein